SFDTGNWYYVAASRDADKKITLYVGDADADLGGTLTTTTSINSADVDLSSYVTPQFLVGGELRTNAEFKRAFDGRIDEVRFSNTALTEGELLFNAMVPEPGS